MKRIFAISMICIFLAMMVYGLAIAQEATTTTTVTDIATTTEETTTQQAIQFGLLSMGQDNFYGVYFGESEPFLAIGGGFDIARYSKEMKYGGVLEITLHATAAAKVTGDDSGALVGGSLNIDMVKLINGTGINILLNDFKFLAGPAILYDAINGKMAYGGLINFSYSF